MTGIIINKTARRAVIRATSNVDISLANLSLTVNSPNSNSAQTQSENVYAAGITQVFWCGNCALARGANTLVTFQTGTAGHMPFMQSGISLDEYPAANVTITINDSNSWMIVEVGKKSSYSTGY